MLRRSLPYSRWLLFILRPLNNRYTWRVRLSILNAMDPLWFQRGKDSMKQKKAPPKPGKGGKKPC